MKENNDILCEGTDHPLNGVYHIQECTDRSDEGRKKTINKQFINNGSLMREYSYPYIKQHFFSPLLNDHNLNLCGGWDFKDIKDEEVISRVVDKKKPMGFYTISDEKKFLLVTEYVKKTGLPFITFLQGEKRENGFTNDYAFEIGISIRGTFGENFNLRELIHDYNLYAKAYKLKSGHIKKFINSIKDIEVKDYLTFDYLYGYKVWDVDNVITGLILGYPIETTVSIMWEE